jgi:hypothetical protein
MLKRMAYRVETAGRVRDLRGFGKGHSIPDRATATARKFIARIAAEDIKADIDETYQALRESFGFKRRQLESSIGDGSGVIRTPNFEYSIHLLLEPNNPGAVVWRREVGQFRDPATIRSPQFLSAFGTMFNTLVFEFGGPVRIEELVDRIEEGAPGRVQVHCASDASMCEITVAGFAGAIRINRTSLCIDGRAAPTASLLNQFFDFLDRHRRPNGR